MPTGRGKDQIVNRACVAAIALIILVAIPACGSEPADPCFKSLPAGWTITESHVIPDDQTAAIGRKLGVGITKLSNTYLSAQGKPIQANIMEATTDADAAKLYEAILRMKNGNSAFCLRKGLRVVEYVVNGNDNAAGTALATKTSYELGFVPKPKQVSYHVSARLAAVDKADYMALTKLFNLFLGMNADAPGKESLAELEAATRLFRFGQSVTMRSPTVGKPESAYAFKPAPESEKDNGETITYSFAKLPEMHGVPYVAAELDITTNEDGLTPSTRKADAALLAATEFWPARDPEITQLAGTITTGKTTRESKVQAILAWLQPGRNIKYGGPVVGSLYGVKQVLKQKYGRCWDFSDCFVTLCRASGIPCRQVAGWLYGSEGHVWAEVLVEGKGWQQFDATGGRCGIYYIPYFATDTGDMPILYLAMPEIRIKEN